MRWIITAGKVPDTVSTIQARADEQQGSVGRWLAAQLDIKALIAVGTVVVALVSCVTAIGRDRVIQQEQLKANAAEIESLKRSAAANVVPRSEYESAIKFLILLNQQQAEQLRHQTGDR